MSQVTEANLCVVVGATGAFGRAVTERLVARGLRVLAVGRRADRLAELAGALEGVTPCVADLSRDGAVEPLTRAVDQPVRLAVYAAGLPMHGGVGTLAPTQLGIATDLKAGGLLRLVRAVDEQLQYGSRIVAFAGSLGLEPKSSSTAQGTANAALVNLMRQLGDAYGPRGITTHTLCPGPCDTPRLRSLAETAAAEEGTPVEEVWARYTDHNSLGRLPTVDEVAWAVEMLLAPEAAVLHGAVLPLDAGGHRFLV